MGIKSGTLLVVANDLSMYITAVKYFPPKHSGSLSIIATSSDGFPIAVHAVPNNRKYYIGLKARTTDNYDAMVSPIKGSYIAMGWMHESNPTYTTGQSIYSLDLSLYDQLDKRTIKCCACCQSPGDGVTSGIHNCINVGIGYPQDVGVNIFMENINEPPNLADSELTDRFDALLVEFRATPPLDIVNPHTILLSSVIGINTLQSAYDNLIIHIQTICPNSDLNEIQFGTEDWIRNWRDYLKHIL